MSSSQNLRKLAEENPKAKPTLLYKADIQDRKHEIVRDEEEFLKVLNIVDKVLSEIDKELKDQQEGVFLSYYIDYKSLVLNFNLLFFLRKLVMLWTI